MISSYQTLQPVPTAEISRLLVAAAINQNFQKLLLSSPAKALAAGFNGETFRLTSEEKRHIQTIRANTLAEFATKVMKQQYS
jgi:hypothetical protein